MTNDLQPRRATPEDIPAMAAIVCDWERATDWMPRPFSDAEIEGFIRNAFDDREIWVIGAPPEAYLSFDAETAKVGGLYCRTPGTGHGKALLDQVKKGRDFVWLMTHEPNLRAQKFYAREGFVAVERVEPDPPQEVWEVKMEWRN